MKIPEGWKLVPIEPTSNMRVAYYDCAPPQFTAANQKWKAMLAAAPPPPAQEDEPVGFINDYGLRLMNEREDICTTISMLHKKHGVHDIPLYRRPQSDKLREAAEELSAYWYPSEDEMLNHYVGQLRAALDQK